MNIGLIAIIITATVVLVTAITSKKPSEIKTDELPEVKTDELPEVKANQLKNLLELSPVDKIYREVIGKAEVLTTALTEEIASRPEIYAASCPPLLYKVSYFDKNHTWTSTIVLATSANAAAASLGQIAGYSCMVSSMSGQQESTIYHTTGNLPAETIIASTEQLATMAKQKATEEIQEEIDRAIIREYTDYPTADKIGASLICNPPTRSLFPSEKDRIAVLRAKDPAYVTKVINAYKAYAAVKGITTIC